MQGWIRRIDALTQDEIRQWDSLLDRQVPNRSPFLSHQWCSLVDRQRGGVSVLVIGDNASIRGFLPFQMKRGRGFFAHGEKVGGHMSDCFDIVGRTQANFDGLAVLRLTKLSALRLDHVPAELGSWPFHDAVPSSGIRVVIDDFPAYMNALVQADKKFTASVRRGERQLAEQMGEVRFTWNVADPKPELERLIAEKRQQYRRTEVGDSLAPEWTRGLLHDLFARESELKPVLSTLFAGQTWLATCLSLAYKDVLHIWFPAYNGEYRRFSPGHVLFFRMFETGAAQGLRLFDFGEGAAQYKRRYRGEEYPLMKGVLSDGGAGGLAEKLIEAARWRINRFRRGAGKPGAESDAS